MLYFFALYRAAPLRWLHISQPVSVPSSQDVVAACEVVNCNSVEVQCQVRHGGRQRTGQKDEGSVGSCFACSLVFFFHHSLLVAPGTQSLLQASVMCLFACLLVCFLVCLLWWEDELMIQQGCQSAST